jgi:type I restriction enzyme S subunit
VTWRIVKLDCIRAPVPYAFVGGPFGSNLTTRDYVEEGIPVIRGNNLPGDRYFHDDDFVFVSEKKANELRANTAYPGDIVFTQRGTLGQVGLIPRIPAFPHYIVSQSQMKLTVDPQSVDPRFVYYFFRLPATVQKVTSHALTSGVPHINLGILKGFQIALPDLIVQQRIAEALGAYDDLIENNRRRISLLEDAGRQLYREWFVRLRFPGHEHTRITDGLPEGWSRKTLADLCESVDYGYTASADRDEIGPRFLRITDIVPDSIDWASVPYCRIEDAKLSKFLLKEGDIVIARTGATVGYAKQIRNRHPEAVFASYLVRLRLNPDVEDLMVGVFVESDDYKQYVSSRVGGAAQPNANAKVLAGAKILIPPTSIRRLYREFVEPLIDQRETLQFQNQHLRAARDLLLPRLMNGEIAV